MDSPEFCKECPFNLPIQEVNTLINSQNLNKKCNERRCVINSKNIDTLETNENDLYEYLCNYVPSLEFAEIKETNDNSDNNNSNNTNNNNDNIVCTKVNKNIDIISDLENNFIYNFFDICNTYSDFYICERTKTPNKFNLEDNFVCPEKKYLTKLIAFSFLNIIFNLILNFIPMKIEYDKYKKIIKIYHPREVIPNTNSSNSTLILPKFQKMKIIKKAKKNSNVHPLKF